MKKAKKLSVPKEYIAPACSLAALLALGAGLCVLWRITGYLPLMMLAMMALMPGGVALMTVLPFGKEKEAPEISREDKKVKRFWGKLRKLVVSLGNFWYQKRTVIVALGIGAVLVVTNLFFWKTKAGNGKNLGYLLPVLLAAGFVLCIIFEKLCAHAGEDKPFLQALLKTIRSALTMLRLSLIPVLITLVVKLLGFYDLGLVLQILLTVLFVYETALLAFGLGVRLIRKELPTAPAFPMTFRDMGSGGLLTYLEENTGITMRSLWSMQLIKTLLPAIAMVMILLIWGLSGLVQIEAHQQGALYRMGKLHPEALEPGLHLTLPWPFDRVEVYNTRSIQELSIGYTNKGNEDNLWTEGHQQEYRLLSGGGNEIISINLRIEYRIDDLYNYLSGSAAPESLLQAAAYEIVTARTIGSDVTTLLAADRVEFSHSFLEELTQRVSTYNTGLTVVDVVLESIHPPVEVASIYQEAVSTELRAERLILDAEAASAVELYLADNQRIAEVSIATTMYYQNIANAKAEVQTFMASVEADNLYHTAYRQYKTMMATVQRFASGTWILRSPGVPEDVALRVGSFTTENPYEDYYVEPEAGEYDDEGNFME